MKHRESGGSVTTPRAKIVPDNKVESLSNYPCTMSIPSGIMRDAVDGGSPFKIGEIVTVMLSADEINTRASQ